MNELHGETAWVHIFKSMVFSGDAAAMGPVTFAVYMVTKCYVNFSTGYSFPSQKTIAEHVGITERQVIKSLKVLEDMGYIAKRKVGKSNVYTLKEKVEFTDKTTTKPVAVATWDYLPSTVKAAVAELRQFKLSGDIEGATVINIEKLVIENPVIVMGDLNVSLADIEDPRLRQALERATKSLSEKIKRKINDV